MLNKMLKGKFEQVFRLLFVNSITFFNNSIIIVEYPKSGGSWLGQLVSEYLDIPFPRNKFPIIKRAVFHSHYLPKYLIPKNKKILWLVRDGRDVSVSFYYHQLIWSNKNKLDPKTVTYTRKHMPFNDYGNIYNNLAKYIKYSFTHKPSKWHYFNFPGNWKSFNLAWRKEYEKEKSNIYMLSYEDLLKDTEKTLKTLLETFFKLDVDDERLKNIVYKFSFENQTKRKIGEEDTTSFIRKGIEGDWKNKFSEEAKLTFKKHAGDTLIKMKYEKDYNW